MFAKKGKFFILIIIFILITSSFSFAGVGNHISSGSSGGSSSSGFSGSVSSPFTGLFLIIAIIVFIIKKWGRKLKLPDEIIKAAENIASDYIDPAINGSAYSNQRQTSLPKLPNNTESIEESIQLIDPEFNTGRFIAWTKEVFIKINVAWTKKDWPSIRPFEHESLYNLHAAQLQSYIDQGRTNFLEKIMVNDTYLYKYDVDNAYEHLTVAINTRLINYVVDDATGRIVSGDRGREVYITYLMTFMRKIGVVTNIQLSNQSTSKCPNCGAPTKITSAGECEFCHMIITTGDHDWVMTHFDSLTQNTVVDRTPITVSCDQYANFIKYEKQSESTLYLLTNHYDDHAIFLKAQAELNRRNLVNKPNLVVNPANNGQQSTEKICPECKSSHDINKNFCEFCGSKI